MKYQWIALPTHPFPRLSGHALSPAYAHTLVSPPIGRFTHFMTQPRNDFAQYATLMLNEQSKPLSSLLAATHSDSARMMSALTPFDRAWPCSCISNTSSHTQLC